jgi:hypothetical protein
MYERENWDTLKARCKRTFDCPTSSADTVRGHFTSPDAK